MTRPADCLESRAKRGLFNRTATEADVATLVGGLALSTRATNNSAYCEMIVPSLEHSCERAAKRAERTGFEPAEGNDPLTDLANRRFRPLSHLSGYGLCARSATRLCSTGWASASRVFSAAPAIRPAPSTTGANRLLDQKPDFQVRLSRGRAADLLV